MEAGILHIVTSVGRATVLWVFISGIGNWIADEVLYQTASSLSEEQCEALHTSIKEVIQHAVQVNADSKEFPVEWLYHFRWEKILGKVNGKKIDFITAASKTTAYVPELQKLYGNAEKAAKVRPGKQGVKSKEDYEYGEEDEQESEKEDDSAKSKKGQKPRGRGKKPASKRKTEDSDGEDEDADSGDDSESEEKVVKPRGRGTKPAIKRKAEENATSQAGKKPKVRKS